MSVVVEVLRCTAGMEKLLEQEFGAKGTGLTEKLNQVEAEFDQKLIKKIRYVARIRNKLCHDPDYQLAEPEAFVITAREAFEKLQKHASGRKDRDTENIYSASEFASQDASCTHMRNQSRSFFESRPDRPNTASNAGVLEKEVENVASARVPVKREVSVLTAFVWMIVLGLGGYAALGAYNNRELVNARLDHIYELARTRALPVVEDFATNTLQPIAKKLIDRIGNEL